MLTPVELVKCRLQANPNPKPNPKPKPNPNPSPSPNPSPNPNHDPNLRCAAGAGCERRHERFCESYSQCGECALGEQCRLSRHRRADAPAGLVSATPAERAMRRRAAAAAAAAAVDSPSCFPQLGTPLGSTSSSSAVGSPLKPP